MQKNYSKTTTNFEEDVTDSTAFLADYAKRKKKKLVHIGVCMSVLVCAFNVEDI